VPARSPKTKDTSRAGTHAKDYVTWEQKQPKV
jgi:hypothetical protein